MIPSEFRNLALSFPGTVESEHMRHPDFRIYGKLFATLGYPDDGWGMVKLTPDQQRRFVQRAPKVFIPCRGVWGARGATNVNLASARKTVVRASLASALRGAKALVKSKRR